MEASGVNVTERIFPPEPALLATCRQIRHEATAIYYAENLFRHIYMPTLLLQCTWLRTIGPARAGQIRTLELYANPSTCHAYCSRNYDPDENKWRRARDGTETDPGRLVAEELKGSGIKLSMVDIAFPSSATAHVGEKIRPARIAFREAMERVQREQDASHGAFDWAR